MPKTSQNLMLAVMCLLVVLLSLAGLAAVILTREIVGVDALLLAMSCIVMATLFSYFLYLVLRAGKESPEPPAAQTAAPKP
jgi:hypothetical protein